MPSVLTDLAFAVRIRRSPNHAKAVRGLLLLECLNAETHEQMEAIDELRSILRDIGNENN